MHATSRRIFTSAITLGVVATLMLGGCRRRNEDIAVGAFLSFSGADSTFGTDTREGIDLAMEQTNAAGGVKGKRVRVVYEDDESTPEKAKDKVRQLIDRDGVHALLGEVSSSRSLAGAIVANEKKVPMVTPASTALDVTRDRPYVFRACFTDAQQGNAAARFVYDKMKKTRVGLLYMKEDDGSSGLADAFEDAFTKLGGRIVARKTYRAKETNFTPILEALEAARPEAIFVPSSYADMVQIARQGKNVGIPGAMFVGGDGWDSEDLLLGAGAELEGATFMNHYAPDLPSEASRRFVKAFKDKFGHEPGGHAAQGYDAARLLFDAMNRAQDPSPGAIKDALVATRNFPGATGTLTIDEDRGAKKPIVYVRVKGKKFTYVDQLTPP